MTTLGPITTNSSLLSTLVTDLLSSINDSTVAYTWESSAATSAFPSVEFPTFMHIGVKLVLGFVLVVTVAVNMLGNSVVCLIVYQKAAMRSSINLLLANMAFSNICLALLAMTFPLATLVTDIWVLGDILCNMAAFFQIFFTAESVYILWIISIDRYLIIVHRKDKLTPCRARRLIMSSWIFSFLVGIPPTIGWGTYGYYDGWLTCVLKVHNNRGDLAYNGVCTTAVFYLPMASMGFCFLCILNTVRHNKSRVHIQTPVDGLSMSQLSKLGLPGGTPTRVNYDVSFKTRAFKTILLLYVVYLVCWSPYAICMLLWDKTQALPGMYLPGACVLWLGYVNSALNPVIYCLRIKKFREACREVVPKSLKLLPDMPERSKRRVHPSRMYECNEQQSNV